MLLLIIILPFLSFICASVLGRFLGRLGTSILTTCCIFLTFIFSCFLFYFINFYNEINYLIIMPWMYIDILQINWGFLFDSLTSIMLCVVTSISTLVHLYSIEYMKEDPHIIRFMSYLSLFTFFMIILITSDNLIQMFIGWEGVGFCSYLLINFWFTRIQANKAAIKAMLVNRISDVSLILGILIIFLSSKTINYNSLFPIIPYLKNFYIYFFLLKLNIIDLICILLIIGAMGKSAQLFLHVWLPDAMEGPTPVSALIHAATMVTAGVFLIIRCSPIFEFSTFILKFIIIIGALTAFFAGTIGLVQNDLKKVIAYSTCSQLGYMFFACGLSNYSGALFHLSNHAFFKALLFLSAGSVIHALSDEQDMRKMGGLKNILPLTYTFFLIGSLALAGFPFLTGFYSKDLILETAYSMYTLESHFAFWLGTFSAFLTAFYSIRLIYLTFLIDSNILKNKIFYIHEPSIFMLLPLFLLTFGSIFIGFLCKDMLVGLGTPFWSNSLFIYSKNIYNIDAEFIPNFYKLIPLFFSFLGLFSSYLLYCFFLKNIYTFKIKLIGNFLYNFLNKKWLFDKIYNELIIQKILKFSYFFTYKVIDKGFFEFYGPIGIIDSIYIISKFLNKQHTGYIFNGLFLFFCAIFFFSLHLLIL